MPEYLARVPERFICAVFAKDDDSARVLIARKLIAEERFNDYNEWIESGLWVQSEKNPPDDFDVRSGFSVRG